MDKLFAAHIAMQMGCYFAGRDDSGAGAEYLYSSLVPDNAWNFGLTTGEITEDQISSIAAMAERRGKQPAVFVPNVDMEKQLRAFDFKFEFVPERWMGMQLEYLTVQPRPSIVDDVKMIVDSHPGEDFERVFANIFDDPVLRHHFQKYFVPTLHAATAPPHGIQPLHLVGYSKGRPIVCASAYVFGDLVGLYNVGTVYSVQKRGCGTWASAAALSAAKAQGGRQAFLQCEVGTHVEDLYKSLGFKVIATPSIANW